MRESVGNANRERKKESSIERNRVLMLCKVKILIILLINYWKIPIELPNGVSYFVMLDFGVYLLVDAKLRWEARNN